MLSVVVFAIAAVIRFAAVLAVNPGAAVYSDMANYDQVALRLQHGMRTGGDTFFPVGYPALLALEYTIVGRHFVFVGIVQAVLGALTCLLVYELALRFGRSPILAFVAGAIAALYPPFLLYGSLLLTEAVAPFWCALAFWLLFRAEDARNQFQSVMWSALTGIALSIAAVTRPNLLLLYPIFALFPLAAQRDRVRWRRSLTMIGLALPLVIVVCVNNSRLLGRPAGLSTNGGINFFLMQADINRVYTPDSTWSPPRNYFRYTQQFRSSALSTDEAFYYREGVDFFLNRPDKARHTLENVLEGFGLGVQGYWPANNDVTDESSDHPALRRILRLCSRAFVWMLIVPVWILTIVGWHLMDRATAAAWMLICSLTAILVVTFAVFLADPRMHVPFDPILIAFSTIAWIRFPATLVARIRAPLRPSKSAL
jgi:dolichyl-phosphate-mannose-protein mannosyltransferase